MAKKAKSLETRVHELAFGGRKQGQRSRRKIVDFILAPVRDDIQRVRRLVRVACLVELKGPRLEAAADEIWRELFRRLFEVGEHDLILKAEAWCGIEVPLKGGKTILAHFVDTIDKQRTLMMVVLKFYTYVGATLERSMQYALMLTEQMGDMVFSFATRPNVESLHATTIGTVAWMEMRMSAALPPDERHCRSGWFSQLLDHVDNDEVERVFRGVIACITAHHSENLQAEVRPDDYYWPLVGALPDILNKPPVVRMTQSQAQKYKAWKGRRDARWQAEKERGEAVLRWFLKEQEWFQQERRRMVAEIRSSASRWLRSDGLDHIEVHVSPLWAAGVRTISFHPEGHMIPDTGIHVAIEKDIPHLFGIPGTLRSFEAEISLTTFMNRHGFDQGALCVMLEYIVIHVLHQIAVRKQVASGEIQTRGDGSRRPSRPTTKVTPHIVRPHIRILSGGRTASDEARARAEQEGWSLPPGVTFVRCHSRGGRLGHNFATAPIAVYTDRSLGF